MNNNTCWLVLYKGEHENWPVVMFRDEELARSFFNDRPNDLYSLEEWDFGSAIEMWEVLNYNEM